MDTKAAILTRRSVRNFIPNKTVPKETITELLRLAMHAPSAHNKQPWEFIVVDDKKIMQAIRDTHPYAKFLCEASLAIVVCMPTTNFRVEDGSAAIQNLLLATHEIGLGACWCGIYPDKEGQNFFSEILKLPENIAALSMVVIGYPATANREISDRYQKNKVHYNCWGNAE